MRRNEYDYVKVDNIRFCLDCVFYAWQNQQISDSELILLENYLEDICIELYGSDSVNIQNPPSETVPKEVKEFHDSLMNEKLRKLGE